MDDKQSKQATDGPFPNPTPCSGSVDEGVGRDVYPLGFQNTLVVLFDVPNSTNKGSQNTGATAKRWRVGDYALAAQHRLEGKMLSLRRIYSEVMWRLRQRSSRLFVSFSNIRFRSTHGV